MMAGVGEFLIGAVFSFFFFMIGFPIFLFVVRLFGLYAIAMSLGAPTARSTVHPTQPPEQASDPHAPIHAVGGVGAAPSA